MLRNPSLWTIITAIITALVYIDLYFLNLFLFTIPVAVLFAIIAIIISVVEKKYVYIFFNIPLAFIACAAYVIFPW